jgi:hypothetical protein
MRMAIPTPMAVMRAGLVSIKLVPEPPEPEILANFEPQYQRATI